MERSNSVISHLVFSDVRRLNHIRRYSSYPIVRQENVAEHLFWVTYSSYLIALDLNHSKGQQVNIELMLQKAMLHDLEESQTGDVVRTFKYHSPETRSLMNQTAIGLISNFLDWTTPEKVAAHMKATLKQSKDESLEGQIVSLADLLAVITYGREELKLGNSNMLDILASTMNYIESYKRNLEHDCLLPYVQEMERYLQEIISTSKET